MESLVSDEKSFELNTDSVTLKNKTESSLLTKLEETKEYQEPKVPESTPKQWQSKRQSECVNQNPAVLSNQRHIPDITPKVNTEVTFFPLKYNIAAIHNNAFLHCGDHVIFFCSVLKCHVL